MTLTKTPNNELSDEDVREIVYKISNIPKKSIEQQPAS